VEVLYLPLVQLVIMAKAFLLNAKYFVDGLGMAVAIVNVEIISYNVRSVSLRLNLLHQLRLWIRSQSLDALLKLQLNIQSDGFKISYDMV
jgi:hypothetical protein